MKKKVDERSATESIQTPQESSKPRRRLVRVNEAAEYLDVRVWRMREMLYQGVLPHLQQGRGVVLIDERDLDEHVGHSKENKK